MKQIVTQGIILSRTNYGEADRILTLLTPDYGKISLLAKGVRKIKSKLAGGIELFSVSNITFIQGRGALGTLASTRLIKHYGNIVKSIERVQLGYELIKILNKATEDEPGPEYFELLEQAFEALNDQQVNTHLIQFWFSAQLLKLGGHLPNLLTDTSGNKLEVTMRYNFSFDDMTFFAHDRGAFTADHIKLLRLSFNGNQPRILQQVTHVDDLLQNLASLMQSILRTSVRV